MDLACSWPQLRGGRAAVGRAPSRPADYRLARRVPASRVCGAVQHQLVVYRRRLRSYLAFRWPQHHHRLHNAGLVFSPRCSNPSRAIRPPAPAWFSSGGGQSYCARRTCMANFWRLPGGCRRAPFCRSRLGDRHRGLQGCVLAQPRARAGGMAARVGRGAANDRYDDHRSSKYLGDN